MLYAILLVIILFIACTPPAGSSTEHVFRYSDSVVGVASRLATVIYVAMVIQFYMTIRTVQITQITNMKFIGLMVDF